LRFLYVHHLHIHLFGKRLTELLFRDQPHFLSDFPEFFATLLLLLFQQHFQLAVVDEAHVDENLTDAANGHRLDPKLMNMFSVRAANAALWKWLIQDSGDSNDARRLLLALPSTARRRSLAWR
jgi:hypothetical protein